MSTFLPGNRFSITKPPRVGSLAWFDPEDCVDEYALPFIKPQSVVRVCEPPEWMLDSRTRESKMEIHVSWCRFLESESVVPVSHTHLRRIMLSRKALETLEEKMLGVVLQLIRQE